MLLLNLRRLLDDKGIEDPHAYLRSLGFTSYTVSRLLSNQVRTISYDRLELLCLRLSCTVNDLFDWQPPASLPDAAAQPLSALQRSASGGNIAHAIRALPASKLGELRDFIDKLGNVE